jgi:hypothetical protein
MTKQLCLAVILATAMIALISALTAAPVFAADDEPLPRTPEDPFAASYVHFEVARNYPVSRSQEQLEAGGYHPAFTYLHSLGGTGRWLLGLGGHYKLLNKREHDAAESDQVALFTLTHETLFAIRLYHPTYLLTGPKLQYFFPSKLAKLPMQRDPEYETEVGVGLSVMIAQVLADRSFLTVRLDRWRGTRTTRLQGIEASVGFAYELD